MIAENPSPDNGTMETLIETNEQLSKAMNQHQRAILSARKAAGLGNGETGVTPPSATPAGRTESSFAAPPGPPPNHGKPSRKAVPKAPQIPPPGDYALTDVDDDNENPFSDPSETPTKDEQKPPFPKDKPPTATGQFNDRLGIEPYHPGFQETPSYTGRQDSSVGKVTMHAAGETSDDDNVSNEGYSAQASGKAPVYRY
jgi:hypothetical protein